MVRAPGHTEDHVVVEVESGGDYALYIGELAQHPVQLERLAWISAFDILPLVSLETKKRFVEKAIEKNATLVSRAPRRTPASAGCGRRASGALGAA